MSSRVRPGSTPARPSACFVGRNRHPAIGEWEVESYVDVYDEGHSFGWATVDRLNPGSRWRFDVEPHEGATRLRFSMSMGPGPSGISIAIEAMPDKEPRILHRRVSEHHANMIRTAEGIKAIIEPAVTLEVGITTAPMMPWMVDYVVEAEVPGRPRCGCRSSGPTMR